MSRDRFSNDIIDISINKINRLDKNIPPTIIANLNEGARRRVLEFFTVNIRNINTRKAYSKAIASFFAWCEASGLSLEQIEPIVVAAYIEQHGASPATVKQHLAAIRMLFDWLVVGQVVPTNPAACVRGPKYVVRKGKTPVLSREETRNFLNSLDTSSVVGLRDRALIGVMVYSFARVGAIISMRVGDYYRNGKRWWLRLHEKGGKFHEMPVHHKLEEYMDSYIDAAGIRENKKDPLFRTAAGKTRKFTINSMTPVDVFRMIRRRAREAGIFRPIGCHTFRAVGITNYLENGGSLENAQVMAAHNSPRTTKLYDRSGDNVSLDEVERIII